MDSYLDQLRKKSDTKGIKLLDAFKQAGVPTSTYYRAINEMNELRYGTAMKIFEAIDEKYEALAQLRSDDYYAGQSETRKRIKST